MQKAPMDSHTKAYAALAMWFLELPAKPQMQRALMVMQTYNIYTILQMIIIMSMLSMSFEFCCGFSLKKPIHCPASNASTQTKAKQPPTSQAGGALFT